RAGSPDDRADRDRDEGDARRVRRRDVADRRTRADRSGIRARRTDEGAAAASGRGDRGAQARAPVEATQLTTRTRVAMVWPGVAARPWAPVRGAAAAEGEIMGEIPAGALLSELASGGAGDWLVRSWRGGKGSRRGSVAAADTAPLDDLPRRPPRPADLLATAQAFLGSRYVWGGTTERGLDCSGFVQQVYRLNGVGLPRDADQQAVFGRPVERARPG